jgi:predicted translin family RNA/ssDNA-binding protein
VRDAFEDVISELERLEEQLRDRALDTLREAVVSSDAETSAGAAAAEKKINQARRGLEKAINALQSLP